MRGGAGIEGFLANVEALGEKDAERRRSTWSMISWTSCIFAMRSR